jgi:nitroreductase
MDFEQLVNSRYSARMFRPESVPDDAVQRILTLAQRTPSWCNSQPWQVVITRGKGTERLRHALYQHARLKIPATPDFPFPAAYLGVYRERRKVCGVQLYQSLGIGRDDKTAAGEQSLENFRLFGAPHVAIVTTADALGAYGMLDCGLYVQTFMLAACSLGVDCIAQAALASYPQLLRELLELPDDRKVVCGVSFGYADASHPIHSYRTERAALSETVRFVDV